MNPATATIMKRSVFLWVGAALVLCLNIFAATQPDPAWLDAALVVTGLFAIVGIGFGVWAARMAVRAGSAPR
jgi:cation transporter-like permease